MRRPLLIILTLTVLIPAALADGGWTKKKKEGYYRIGQWATRASEFYTPGGDRIPITTTGVYFTSLYAEYGITDRLTGIVYFPFFGRSTLNEVVDEAGNLISEGDELNSVGDTDITLKYGIIQNKPIVLSVSLTLGLPFGESSGGETGLLQTGDGEFNQLITLYASHSFKNKPMWVSLSAGYNNRTKGFTNEFRYGFEFGYQWRKWNLIYKMNGIKPLSDDEVEGLQSNGLFNNQVEFLTWQPEVAFDISDKVGINASVTGIFYGKRILSSLAYSGGVYFKM